MVFAGHFWQIINQGKISKHHITIKMIVIGGDDVKLKQN